jgi:hypothetical protein
VARLDIEKRLFQKNFFTQSNNEDEETKIDFQRLSLYTLSSLCSLCETSSLLRQPLFEHIYPHIAPLERYNVFTPGKELIKPHPTKTKM